MDVIIGREMLPNQLPKENPNLQGDRDPPDFDEVSPGEDRIENLPEASNVQEMMSGCVESWQTPISRSISRHSNSSLRPMACLSGMRHSPMAVAYATEESGSTASAEILGNRSFKMPGLCHQSSQNLVERPHLTWCFAHKQKTDLTFWIAFQNWDPPL
jgi:hypothetical protein